MYSNIVKKRRPLSGDSNRENLNYSCTIDQQVDHFCDVESISDDETSSFGSLDDFPTEKYTKSSWNKALEKDKDNTKENDKSITWNLYDLIVTKMDKKDKHRSKRFTKNQKKKGQIVH